VNGVHAYATSSTVRGQMFSRELCAAVFAALISTTAAAQSSEAEAVFPESNGRALAGVKAFDAKVVIETWLSMARDREVARENAQAAFELGLRRDGVVVEGAAPNFLFCTLSFAQSGGIIFYSWRVEYYDYRRTGVIPLIWTSGGIATVGSGKFSDEEPAKDCADTFANEWLKWNPRR
jgi:hypothetical protein